MRVGRLRAVAALVVFLSCLPVFAGTPVTVGEFMQEIAHLRGLPSQTAEVAVASLRDAGIRLPDDRLDAVLTEGAVASIVNALGVDVRTSQPAATFNSDQMGRFLLTMTRELTGADPEGAGASEDSAYPRPNGNAADPLTKGKGLKKGLRRSPSDPL